MFCGLVIFIKNFDPINIRTHLSKTHLSLEYLIVIYTLYIVSLHKINSISSYIIFRHPHLRHISERVSSLVSLLIGIIYLIKL